MATATVQAGICGMSARIVCTADEVYNVSVAIESDCPRIQAFARALQSVAVLGEMRTPLNETSVYRAAGASGLHAACPVPSATYKAIEVAADLALPADVHITVSGETG